MLLFEHFRNEARRLCSPIDTINRIVSNLKNFGIDVVIRDENECKEFFWCRVDRSENFQWKKFGDDQKPLFDIGIGSNGKGTSRELSYASGLSEFVERLQYYIFYEESTSRSIDVFSLVSAKYFDVLCKLNSYPLFNMKATAYSLNRQDVFSVPFDIISFLSGTNGLASGNVIEEAIIHGSCEIFERFSAGRAILDKKPLYTINKKLIKDSNVCNFMDFLAENNIETCIKDTSCNGLMPSVGVLFYNKNIEYDSNPFKRERTLTLQVASSFSFEEAISRCFSEHIQNNVFEEVKYRRRSDYHLIEFQRIFPGVQHQSPNTPYTVFRSGLCTMNLSHLLMGPTINFVPEIFSSNSVLGDLESIKNIGTKLRSEILIIDISNKIIDFPAVRVIIPRFSDTIHLGNPVFSDSVFNQWKGLDFDRLDVYRLLNSLDHKTIEQWLKKYSSSKEEYHMMMSLDIEALKRFALRRIGISNWVRGKMNCTLEDRITSFYSNVW